MYDADGRIDTATDAEDQTTDYTYDLAGRLLELDPETGASITFAYDDSDRLDTVTDGNGTTTHGYDAVGRTTSVARGATTVGYAYDDAGRLETVTYPGSTGTVSYGFDAAGRTDSVTDWAERVTSYEYDDASRVTDVRAPGGLDTTIAYDELNRPTDVSHVRGGTTVLALGYGYDANGNITTLVDDTGSAVFSYDDLDRLTAADFAGTGDYGYTYDTVGNLLSASGPSGTKTYTYDLADRITSAGFGYDANGNLTADPARTYAYDPLGRLASVTASGITTAYTLDGLGNRWAETTGAATTSFALDLTAPNPTVLSDGTRTYLPGAPGAGYEEAGTWWTGLPDQTGSPLIAVSESGSATPAIHYDPFGGPRAGSATTGIGYAGEWRDPAGLVNLRARAYDPSVGRFTSRDTFAGVLSAPQTGNRYAYALNNPYRYTDPSGRFVTWAVNNGPMLTSTFVQALPGVGDAYSFFIGVIGYDPIAGVALSDGERGLAIASAVVIGGGFWLAGRLAGDTAREAGSLGRVLEDAPVGGVSTVGREADQLTSGSRLASGLDGGVDSAVSRGGLDIANPPTIVGDAGPAVRVSQGSADHYFVAYETYLPTSAYPGRSRGHHFQEANRQLIADMDSSPEFSGAIDKMIPDIRSQLVGTRGGLKRGAPTAWTWHHGQLPGQMQLIQTSDHAAPGPIQSLLHPGGRGGFSIWG